MQMELFATALNNANKAFAAACAARDELRLGSCEWYQAQIGPVEIAWKNMRTLQGAVVKWWLV